MIEQIWKEYQSKQCDCGASDFEIEAFASPPCVKVTCNACGEWEEFDLAEEPVDYRFL